MFDEIDYNPKPVKNSKGEERPNPIEGIIKLKTPDYPSAIRLKKIQASALKAGTQEVDYQLAFDAQEKLVQELNKWVIKVDLIIPSKGNFVVSDLVTLGKSTQGQAMIDDCVQSIVKGVDLLGND